MDNSKRTTYGVNLFTENFKANVSQSFEFTNNSNFHRDQKNENKLSDILGSLGYFDKIFIIMDGLKSQANVDNCPVIALT